MNQQEYNAKMVQGALDAGLTPEEIQTRIARWNAKGIDESLWGNLLSHLATYRRAGYL